jgi:5'-nucleotidase/UDP-sugar diphosphatase
MKHKGIWVAALFVFLLCAPALAGETVTIVYQNDLHGWLFPSSTRVGMERMLQTLTSLFEKEHSSFYALSGDLFTGPPLPDNMKGASELAMWNHFWEELEAQGVGHRALISAGNHDFDYGVPVPSGFSSGLLCANVVTEENRFYYVPYRVSNTKEGLRVGFIGLLIEENRRVLGAIAEKKLHIIPTVAAVKRVLPEMGSLDLTVLMVHDYIRDIVELAYELSPELGVDIIFSGHNHLILENPLFHNGIYILQAGAMNNCYGQADLLVEGGRIVSLKNTIVYLKPSLLEHTMLRVKEKVDELNGKTVAILKQSMLASYLRGQENSLGNFVTDAFRWATGTDVAMTNSGSLRMDFPVYPGEPFDLKEGHFKTMTPFQNHLVVGEVTGAQIMEILEGEAIAFRNQVSGLTYKIDRRKSPGRRVLEARIGGAPIRMDRIYTLTHNSYCTRPEHMERYLHLKPGSIKWKPTALMDNEVLGKYARQLKVIDYPSGGEGRIVIVP